MPPADPVWERRGLPRTGRPLALGGLRLPHRVLLGSMHTGLEVRDDGGAALAAFYRERVEGGAALIVTGGVAVNADGRAGPDYAVLTEPGDRARLEHAVTVVHEAGGRILAQLFHAGRYALRREGEPAPVAPSAVPWRAARGAFPRELSADDVLATIEDYAEAARAAISAGFDGVELMASEGYLINQFCSPLTNRRDDAWGGDTERRRRFAVAVLAAVRAAVPAAAPVTVRVSGDDLMPGSSTEREVADLVLALVAAGADAISVGVGWHESTVPTVQAVVPHGAWVPVAERLARVVGASARPDVPVIASNRITDLAEAEAVLAGGLVDAVALARPFLADPHLVRRTLAGAAPIACIGCDQACIDRSLVSRPVSCLVNPRAGEETRYPLRLVARPRRIAVVGGGPAGLTAALDLVRRGHAVQLLEADDRLGGQFRLAARVPGKEDYGGFVEAARRELLERGAEVRLGTRAAPAELVGFDGVLVATGVQPRRLALPGAELPHVLPYDRALREGVPPGRVVVIGGGGIGIDTATTLVEPAQAPEPLAGGAPPPGPRPGAQVTVLRRGGRFGTGVGASTRWVVLGRLREAGVTLLGDVAYRAITPDGVVVEAGGAEVLLPADVVVVCIGQEPDRALADGLLAAGVPAEVVGGARSAAGLDAVRATREALDAARRIAP